MPTLRDLLERDDPISWALENLEMIGHGSCSYVFSDPDRADVVLRICEDADAWYWYASELVENGTTSRHAPRVHDIAVHNGIYGAEVERLSPVTDEALLASIDAFASRRPHDLPPSMIDFLADCPVRATDLRDENWMMRGDVLVLNDPSGRFMDEVEKCAFLDRHALRTRSPSP